MNDAHSVFQMCICYSLPSSLTALNLSWLEMEHGLSEKPVRTSPGSELRRCRSSDRSHNFSSFPHSPVLFLSLTYSLPDIFLYTLAYIGVWHLFAGSFVLSFSLFTQQYVMDNFPCYRICICLILFDHCIIFHSRNVL